MQILNDYSHAIVDTLREVSSVEVFQDGKRNLYAKNSQEYIHIVNQLMTLWDSARVDPAFGVSLHDETIAQMQKDIWVKLNFDKPMEKNGLPFTVLLFKVEDAYGINLIREYDGKYEGRCIYLNFFDKIKLTDILKNN